MDAGKGCPVDVQGESHPKKGCRKGARWTCRANYIQRRDAGIIARWIPQEGESHPNKGRTPPLSHARLGKTIDGILEPVILDIAMGYGVIRVRRRGYSSL
jgi:hypothetical protein